MNNNFYSDFDILDDSDFDILNNCINTIILIY